jgi:hypothetical protein
VLTHHARTIFFKSTRYTTDRGGHHLFKGVMIPLQSPYHLTVWFPHVGGMVFPLRLGY